MSKADWGLERAYFVKTRVSIKSWYVKKKKPDGFDRQWDRWTEDQLEELRRRKANFETNAQIAIAMGRTCKAIKTQWEKR